VTAEADDVVGQEPLTEGSGNSAETARLISKEMGAPVSFATAAINWVIENTGFPPTSRVGLRWPSCAMAAHD